MDTTIHYLFYKIFMTVFDRTIMPSDTSSLCIHVFNNMWKHKLTTSFSCFLSVYMCVCNSMFTCPIIHSCFRQSIILPYCKQCKPQWNIEIDPVDLKTFWILLVLMISKNVYNLILLRIIHNILATCIYAILNFWYKTGFNPKIPFLNILYD